MTRRTSTARAAPGRGGGRPRAADTRAGHNRGRSYAGNIVSVLNPTTTNESLVTFSRLTLDTSYRDPSRLRLDALNADFQGSSPSESVCAVTRQLGRLAARRLRPVVQRCLRAQRRTAVRRQAHEGLGRACAEVRREPRPPPEAAERVERRERPDRHRALDSWWHGQSDRRSAGWPPAQILQGTRAKDTRFRMWNVDAFAQDSWKIRPNVTLEYGVRLGYWTNNAEQNDLGNWFDPGLYDSAQRRLHRSAVHAVERRAVRIARPGAARSAPNRDPFALPRINVAWDIRGNGLSVLRGGYGMFANRPVGNVEYFLGAEESAERIQRGSERLLRYEPRRARIDLRHVPSDTVLGPCWARRSLPRPRRGRSRSRGRTATVCRSHAGFSGTRWSRQPMSARGDTTS